MLSQQFLRSSSMASLATCTIPFHQTLHDANLARWVSRPRVGIHATCLHSTQTQHIDVHHNASRPMLFDFYRTASKRNSPLPALDGSRLCRGKARSLQTLCGSASPGLRSLPLGPMRQRRNQTPLAISGRSGRSGSRLLLRSFIIPLYQGRARHSRMQRRSRRVPLPLSSLPRPDLRVDRLFEHA